MADWIVTTWIRVRAPVRVLDAGGWTDTWFAGGGTVCHLAVEEGAEVSVRRWEPRDTAEAGMVDLRVPDFGDRYHFALRDPPGRHPLLEAALRRWAWPGWRLAVSVASSVPPGSSLGTSASVTVGMITALLALAGKALDPAAIARAAHDVETLDLGLQSGVQDQIAAAYGGSNLITIDAYPDVTVQTLELAAATWDALARRVVTAYLGSPHRSNAVHRAVMARLTRADPETLLAPLRAAAKDAAIALVAGNLDTYGEAMNANTAAQAALHPSLVNPFAREVIALAKAHGAVGWKVNGAGGEGGTVTIVGPEDPGPLVNALSARGGLTVLPLRPARQGARVVDQG
jgi:D-glycero-alpha-D-manno-heptose-7-phosphate kinase